MFREFYLKMTAMFITYACDEQEVLLLSQMNTVEVRVAETGLKVK